MERTRAGRWRNPDGFKDDEEPQEMDEFSLRFVCAGELRGQDIHQRVRLVGKHRDHGSSSQDPRRGLIPNSGVIGGRVKKWMKNIRKSVFLMSPSLPAHA